MRRNVYPLNNEMGNVSAAMMAAEAYKQYQQGKNQQGGAGGAGSGMPGMTPGGGGPSTSATAVSPNIQTTISPQISPVFQQAEAGAQQTAATTSIAPGGQTATGGGASAAPPPMSSMPGMPPTYGVPSMPTFPSLPPSATPSDSFDIQRYYTPTLQPATQQGGAMTLNKIMPWLVLGGIGLALALYFNRGRK